jgi:Cu+-exporting ATPase
MHGGGMAHGGEPGAGQAIDPVCGMTVNIAVAMSRNLHYRHEGVDYYFCGRGCRLDFEEDPARYLDPGYQPSM